MYKIVLADKSIYKFDIAARLNEAGFELCAILKSCSELAVYVDYHKVDCILISIDLNETLTLNTVERIFSKYPHIKIVLISDKKDFSCIQNAIKLGITDFLVKPLDPHEFTISIKEIKKKLDEEYSRSTTIDSYIQFIFRNIYMGLYSDSSEYIKILSKWNISISESMPCAVLILNADGAFSAKTDSVIKQINMFNITPYCVSNDENSIIYLLISPDANNEKFKSYVNMFISKYNNEDSNKISSFKYKFFQSLEKFKNRFSNDLLLEKSIKIKFNELMISVNNQNYINTYYKLKDLFSSLKDYPLSELINFSKYLINITEQYIFIDTDELNINYLINEYSLRLEKCNNVNGIKSNVFSFFKLVTRPRVFTAESRNHSILQICNYIKEHYTENITLYEAAEMVSLTPNYFSKLFKEFTGETFMKFVIDNKIEVSKKLLLNTDIKLNDLSLDMGYQNTSSFTRFFKEHTGFSPSEFRIYYANKRE